MTKAKNLRMGILTFPTEKSGNAPLLNLVDALRQSSTIPLITGGSATTLLFGDERVRIMNVTHVSGKGTLSRILAYARTQLSISFQVLRGAKYADAWVFYFGGDTLLIPLIFAKLTGRKVVMDLAGSSVDTLVSAADRLSTPAGIVTRINLALSDAIVVYSRRLTRTWKLERHVHKILVAPTHAPDLTRFASEHDVTQRSCKVGYVGRMSEEKGILNLAGSIPLVLSRNSDLRFTLAGDGRLRNRVTEYIRDAGISKNVDIVGWVPYDQLPTLLGELRLVVLPSYTEGLPNIILEAMACGTPVLATPVGGVLDIVKDGETGFIMESNDPEVIAQNIIRAVNCRDLAKISKAARALVEREFTCAKATERWIAVRDFLSE